MIHPGHGNLDNDRCYNTCGMRHAAAAIVRGYPCYCAALLCTLSPLGVWRVRGLISAGKVISAAALLVHLEVGPGPHLLSQLGHVFHNFGLLQIQSGTRVRIRCLN